MQAKVRIQLFLAISLLTGSLGLDQTRAKVRYDDYHVYRITPAKESDISLLQDIEGSSDAVIFVDGIHLVRQNVDAIVAAHKSQDFEIVLEAHQIKFNLLTTDLQEDLKDFTATIKFDVYNSFEDANNWIESLPETYPGIVEVGQYGMSYEKRKLHYVQISYNTTRKDTIFVEAGMNGHEWMAPATALYLINELLTSSNPKIKQIAKNYNWLIIPHVNPDGFEYSHTVDRLWRKTRKPYGASYGVNMDRNFNYEWGKEGASLEACSTSYAGPHYDSESETFDLRQLVHKTEEDVKLYISLHAFGQRLEYPRNTTNQKILEICNVAIAALKKRYGTVYKCGDKFTLREPETGTFMDWVYKYESGLRSVLAYSYKLRPAKRSFETGFQLDEKQIVPTAKETLDSFIAMIEKAEFYNYLKPKYATPKKNNQTHPTQKTHPTQNAHRTQKTPTTQRSHPTPNAHPTKKTHPTPNAHPTKKTHPTQNVHPTKKTHPTQAAHPTQKTHPTPNAHPTKKTHPTQNVHPTKKTHPTPNAHPTKKTHPTQNAHPTKKTHPTQPTQPTKRTTITNDELF